MAVDGSMRRVPPDDLIQPFQIDPFSLRGRLVRLGPVADSVLSRHDYPEPVAVMLGETLALAAALAGALKYEGVFTLQTKSDGPISMLVADVTSGGAMRGYAEYDAERVSAAAEPGGAAVGDSVPRLLGSGHLAFTVDQGPDTDRYQGIVELVGATLADCAHQYFRQSEQIEAAIKLAVGRVPDLAGQPVWRAASMMIQRLPEQQPDLLDDFEEDDAEDGWRRALILMGSSTSKELLDPALAPNDLLYRLFHEDGVRVYRPTPLVAGCRCSRERVGGMLRAFPREEVEDMRLDDTGDVVVTCQFCNTSYVFDEQDLDELYQA